ncbi:hypothetical protein [Klebsiella phage Kpn74]|uniref:Uncharacterized protein n=1 Tax=Klebsiella phage Kpn74 TaxID=3044026 RepID=A0AAT9V558_9CAUD|nr:hypothetical protein [Klebsiella phage Kpn74]
MTCRRVRATFERLYIYTANLKLTRRLTCLKKH